MVSVVIAVPAAIGVLAAVMLLVVPHSARALEDWSEWLDEALVREFLGDDDPVLAEAAMDEQLRDAAAFRDNPVDVNAATPALLERVPALAPDAALRVLAEREENGPFVSLDDLVARACLSRTELAAVRPYLVAIPAVPPASSGEHVAPPPALAWSLRVRAVSSEDREGSWAGDGVAGTLGTFGRLRASYGAGLSLGLSCEKDAGERSFLDHAVGHATWSNRASSSRGVAHDDGSTRLAVGVGDFVGSWAQGLVLRSGGFPSTSAYPRMTDSMRGYDGAGEATSRRGLFLSLGRGHGCAQVVVARTRLDAAVGEDGAVTSIRESGYHRTSGEEDGEGALEESLEGVRLRLGSVRSATVGLSFLRVGFSPGLAPGDPERQHYRFSGESLAMGGADVVFERDGVRLGCEAVRMSSGGTGVLAAVRARRGKAVVSAGLASLSRDHWSPVGGGAPGVSGGTNGTAAWLNLSYRLPGPHRVWVEARVARRPWRSYHLDLPDGSVVTTLGCELSAGTAGRGTVEFKLKRSADEEGTPPESVERAVSRLKLSFRTRGEAPAVVSLVRAGSSIRGVEEGRLLAVAARIEGSALGCACSAGVTSVTRSGSLPAFVGYEPSLPGEFALRSLNASGVRWYIRVRRNLTPGFDIAARLGGGPGRASTEFAIGIDMRS